ncbi:MAG: KH domain-containing protein [Actinomycetota bacterium]|nr:KH domain-containing protein [Actinomycetota bacterium]
MTEEVSRAEEVLVYLITQIVEDKDAVEIEIEETDTKISMMAKVAQNDMGRVIGKRGRVAHAIRTLVRAAAIRDGIEVEVDFDG